jgi:hypothetical protein
VLFEEDPAGTAALVGVDRMIDHRGIHESHKIWTRTYPGVPIASAQQANVITDIRAGFTSCIADTQRTGHRILSDPAASR